MSLEFDVLLKRYRVLEEENKRLKAEVDFLKMHPVFVKGFKGEQIVCDMTAGSLTSFAAKYDLLIRDKVKVEIKYSKVTQPNLKGISGRWNWSKPLGFLDKGKDYDFLLLIGDKDFRFADQYPDDSPYVFFLIPHFGVNEIMSSGKTIGGNILLTTNFQTFRAEKSKAIFKFMVPANDVCGILDAINL